MMEFYDSAKDIIVKVERNPLCWKDLLPHRRLSCRLTPPPKPRDEALIARSGTAPSPSPLLSSLRR